MANGPAAGRAQKRHPGQSHQPLFTRLVILGSASSPAMEMSAARSPQVLLVHADASDHSQE